MNSFTSRVLIIISTLLFDFGLGNLHSQAEPCDMGYVLKGIGGFENFKAIKTNRLSELYNGYKVCYLEAHDSVEFRFLGELGLAYLSNLDSFDKSEYNFLLNEARKRNNKFVQGILVYRRYTLSDSYPKSHKLKDLQEALNLI